MFRVLIAYAQSDPAVGYCQGMSFLTALFLAYLREEDAFWMLTTVMRHPPLVLRDVFSPGMAKEPALEHVLQGLINLRLPRLAARLAAHGVHPLAHQAGGVTTQRPAQRLAQTHRHKQRPGNRGRKAQAGHFNFG